MSEQVLQINQLKKNYGAIQALKGVSFSIPRGTVFGILGPNGSGKTTLLGILLDVLNANDGNYEWRGYKDAQTARKHIGTLLETPNFYHYLSAFANLEIVCKIKGISTSNIEKALKNVNLWDRKDTAFQTYSLGMKQRLAIASALLGDPEILVLDEPTNGLDPVGIAEIRNLISQLNVEGKTVIMASHMLDEVEKTCTHVAILQKGELLMTGHVDEVLSNEDWVELSSSNNKLLENILQQSALVANCRSENNVLHVQLHNNASIEAINQYCMERQVILTHINSRKRSLESKFMELTNQNL